MGLFLLAFSSSPKFDLRAVLSVKTGFHANRVLLKNGAESGSSQPECNSALTQSDHGRADAATSLSWRGQPVGLFVGFYLPIFSQPYLINTSDEFKFSPLWDSFESKWVRCNKKDQIDKICSFLVLFHPWALTRGKQSNCFLSTQQFSTSDKKMWKVNSAQHVTDVPIHWNRVVSHLSRGKRQLVGFCQRGEKWKSGWRMCWRSSVSLALMKVHWKFVSCLGWCWRWFWRTW